MTDEDTVSEDFLLEETDDEGTVLASATDDDLSINEDDAAFVTASDDEDLTI
ncbi:MAG: hypothetical protein WDN27_02890 [Candidatus Saccharibacteria bacterium]